MVLGSDRKILQGIPPPWKQVKITRQNEEKGGGRGEFSVRGHSIRYCSTETLLKPVVENPI